MVNFICAAIFRQDKVVIKIVEKQTHSLKCVIAKKINKRDEGLGLSANARPKCD